MTTFARGSTQILTALFFSAPSVPTDVTGLTMQVIDLTNNVVVLGPIIVGFGHPAVGVYTYPWTIPANAQIGPYLISWSGMVGASSISALESVNVAAVGSDQADDFYRPGPCHPYDPISMCTLDAASAAVSGVALQAASEILYYATAQRFDSCQVTLRPCRKVCPGENWPPLGTGWWEYGQYPYPALINGLWYNFGCGSCGENCSCVAISETILPGPVQRIVQVTVDGVVLTAGVDYRLDDYRKLVRLGDIWPNCNNLNEDTSQVGTWSVTAIYGEPLPTLGRIAAGELMCAIIADIIDGGCNLPANVTELARQGVTITLENSKDLLETGFEGLKYVDKFIQRYNPHNLMARPYMYDLDSPTFRITDTTIT